MSVKYCRTISMGKFPRLPLRRSLRKSSWELLYDRLHFSSQFLWDGEGLYPANFLLCCKIEWYSLSWNLHPTQLNIIIWIQFRCIVQLFFSFFFFASQVNFIRRGVFAHPCFVASYFFFFGQYLFRRILLLTVNYIRSLCGAKEHGAQNYNWDLYPYQLTWWDWSEHEIETSISLLSMIDSLKSQNLGR